MKGKRSVMWFLWKQGKSGKEILREMREVYGDDCPSKSTVYLWIERFEDGWNTADDYGHPGRPISTGYQGNIDLVSRTIDIDRRFTVRQLEETLGIPKTTIHRILSEDLRMSRVAARWVPKLFPKSTPCS